MVLGAGYVCKWVDSGVTIKDYTEINVVYF